MLNQLKSLFKRKSKPAPVKVAPLPVRSENSENLYGFTTQLEDLAQIIACSTDYSSDCSSNSDSSSSSDY